MNERAVPERLWGRSIPFYAQEGRFTALALMGSLFSGVRLFSVGCLLIWSRSHYYLGFNYCLLYLLGKYFCNISHVIEPLCRLSWLFSMGGVLAASSPNPPPPVTSGAAPAPGLTVPPGFGMPPVSPVIPSTGADPGQQQEARTHLPNPGAFDECHRKCKGKCFIFPSVKRKCF